MDTLTLLQHYWWLLISLLGALLVFLLYVQGGQALLYTLARTEEERDAVVDALGHKWEITFTTLVTFGGAFFASFPLFYSTSFGGAFYVWMLLLLVFVLQAVAFEYRRKPHNLFGTKTFEWFLIVNGVAGPLLLGTAVGTFFTGANFTVDRLNMADLGGDTTISQWTTPWHGLEAIGTPALLLGIAFTLLALLLACHFFLHEIDHGPVRERAQRLARVFTPLFLLFFLVWLIRQLLIPGAAADPVTGVIEWVPYRHLNNLIRLPYLGIGLLAGIVLVLAGLWQGARGRRNAIWLSGTGTVLTVLALLLATGWNHTSYYPSLADLQSSLTIRNSSSSLFTLKVMSIVSLFIPVVVAYIAYTWHVLDRRTKPGDGDGALSGGDRR